MIYTYSDVIRDFTENGEISNNGIEYCLNDKAKALRYFKENNIFLYEELLNTVICSIKPVIDDGTPTHFTIKYDNFSQIFNTFKSSISEDNKIIWIKNELSEMMKRGLITINYKENIKDCFNKIDKVFNLPLTLFNKKMIQEDIQKIIDMLPDEPVFNKNIVEIMFNSKMHNFSNFSNLFKNYLISKHNDFHDLKITEGYSQTIFGLCFIEYWISDDNAVLILKSLTDDEQDEIFSYTFEVGYPGKISTLINDEVDIRTIICPIKEIKTINEEDILNYYKQFSSDINYPKIVIDNLNITISFSKEGKYLMDATNALIEDMPKFLGLENYGFEYKKIEY